MATVPCTIDHRNGHTAPSVIPAGPALLPEASCSVNLRFAVGPYGQMAQATGRGMTAAEAARNLRETMEATRAELAPPPPPTREARLAQLLACGLTRAVAKGDGGLVERLAKAAALVLSGAVEPTERAQALAVRSQRDMNVWYTVEGLACSCPDWGKRRGDETPYHCKHRLAVWLWRQLLDGQALDAEGG